jgi:hypothetical protein
MKMQFSQTEKELVKLFKESKESNELISFQGKYYYIREVDKPTVPKGEPKTDIYLYMEESENRVYKEIKISVKQNNADFLENKMKAERAAELFGKKWQDIIRSSILKLKDKFENRTLIYRQCEKRTKEGAITLGWKFELLNKIGGELSGEIEVSAYEVYSGSCLEEDKRNAFINGRKVMNSGVADYLLFCDIDSYFNNTEEVLNNLLPLKLYVEKNPKIYFACKALNLRTKEKNAQGTYKWDGDRPLSVYINWEIQDSQLSATIKYDAPLQIKGNKVAKKLIEALNKLNFQDISDLKDNNVKKCNDICN